MPILRAGGLGGGGLSVSRLNAGRVFTSGVINVVTSPNVSQQIYYNPITWSATDKDALITLSNNQLTAALASGTVDKGVRATETRAGIGYFEVVASGSGTLSTDIGFGNPSALLSTYVGQSVNSWGYTQSGTVVSGDTSRATGLATYTFGDVIGAAIDAAGVITWYKNGTYVWDTSVAGGSLSGIPFPIISINGTTYTATANFGATPLQYLPVGVQSWDGNQVGSAVSVSGDGSATGLATVTAVGASTVAEPGSSTGLATVTAVGAATESAAGSSAGSATVTATGAATKAAAGSAIGSGTATAGGAETSAATGSSTAAGSASAVGAAKEAAAGSAAGSATVTGGGNTFASGSGAGAANGTATVAGIGASKVAATGTAAGSAVVTAIGVETAAGTGTAIGAGTAAGIAGAAAPVTVSGTGLAVGSSTATATSTAGGVVHVGKWHVVNPALSTVPQGAYDDGFSDGFEVDTAQKSWQVATAKPAFQTPWHVTNPALAVAPRGAYSDGFDDGFDIGGIAKVWEVANAKPKFATQGSFSKDFSADFEVGTAQKWRVVAGSKPIPAGAYDDGFSDGFETDAVTDKIWKKAA